MTWRLADTQDARDAQALIADEIATGLSVEFADLESQRRSRRLIHRIRVDILRVALVHNPAFRKTRVTGLRSHDRSDGSRRACST